MEEIGMVLCSGVGSIYTQYSEGEEYKPGDGFKSSVHPHREIFFAIEGRSRYMLNNRVYDAVPGSVFLIDRWVPHAVGYLESDHDLLHLWFHMPGSVLDASIIRVESHGRYKLDSKPVLFPSDLQSALIRRWDALNNRTEISVETVRRYMKAPLNALLDETAFQLSDTETAAAETADNIVRAVKNHIKIMNARGCSLKHLEQISGYSRFYLSHRFQKVVGCTIGEYVDRVRADYTREAFRRGLKQKEIAFELGFSSPSNFWSWLQKHKNRF
ncbi:MAG: DNA-binding transcriptional regulator SoxS [Lentisphaerae bacterium ADurb.Bin242]|nr:MAG: DNA-binding transcriptional regulator SoxS [Lentisphaerae bacterium ADurb.Bin242]